MKKSTNQSLKKLFSVYSLTLRRKELSFTLSTFEADHHVPDDQSHLPQSEHLVQEPEYYRADEFAYIIHNKNPFGVADDIRKLYATELERALSKTYIQVSHGQASAQLICADGQLDNKGFIYSHLLTSIQSELQMLRVDIDEEISRLRTKQDELDIMHKRSMIVQEPTLIYKEDTQP